MKKDLFLISGASTGIGRALAEHYAAQGHKVLAGVRTQNDLAALQVMANVVPIILDVTRSQDLEKIPTWLAEHLPGLGKLVLINNAGIAVFGPWELVGEADLCRQMQINVMGPILLTQKCLPALRKTKGHVFNISSISGLFASPFLGPYAVSKHALEAFSDSLRREMFRFGVSVTSINPGPIKTPIWQKGLEDPNRDRFQKDPTYGALLTKFELGVKEVASKAIDVSEVIAAVDQAYLSSAPPARTLVATFGTTAVIKLSRILPDRIVDQLVKRF